MPGFSFINFKTVKHGAQNVSAVRRIVVDIESETIERAGDGQAGPTIVEIVGRRVVGRVELDDVAGWESLPVAAEADLTFVGEAAGNGTDQDVRIRNVTFGPADGQWFDGKPGSAAGFVLSFLARFDTSSAPTLQDLVSVEDV